MRAADASKIDLRTLRSHIREMLQCQTQASIGELLATFPAEQALGSVVGYFHLGARHGEQTARVRDRVMAGRGSGAAQRPGADLLFPAGGRA